MANHWTWHVRTINLDPQEDPFTVEMVPVFQGSRPEKKSRGTTTSDNRIKSIDPGSLHNPYYNWLMFTPPIPFFFQAFQPLKTSPKISFFSPVFLLPPPQKKKNIPPWGLSKKKNAPPIFVSVGPSHCGAQWLKPHGLATNGRTLPQRVARVHALMLHLSFQGLKNMCQIWCLML